MVQIGLYTEGLTAGPPAIYYIDFIIITAIAYLPLFGTNWNLNFYSHTLVVPNYLHRA